MRMLITFTAISLTLTGSAFAYDGCGPAGCGPGRDCEGTCSPTVKKVDIKKTCFNIELKKICVPPTRFPWDPSPCDSVCGDQGACGAGCTPSAAACGAGQCGAGSSTGGGLFGQLRDLLGMSNKGKCRTIKVAKKSSVKCGETCACDWKCDDPSIPSKGCAPACVAPSAAPAAEEAPGPAPDETAARVRLRRLR